MPEALKYSLYSDDELIACWRKDEKGVFEYIYHQHAVRLLSIAVHKTGDMAVAQELVQDTFLSLYRHKTDLKTGTHLPAYLYLALKRNILNYYRKQTTHKRYEAWVQQQASGIDHSTEYLVNTRELELLLSDHIERLPPQCRMVFKLSRLEGLTDKEIAAKMKISVNTVEQHKRKALKILRFAFRDYLGVAFLMTLLK